MPSSSRCRPVIAAGLALPAAAATFALTLAAGSNPAQACTSLLATRGATADGSTMVTYAADSHELYGDLVVRPPTVNAPGTKRDVIEWDIGKRLGDIPQAARTYAVVGNINEKQVAIAETTFGGREELVDPKGGIDYGTLIYVALERAATAREAIQVMTGLASEFGFASEGESFSIADPKEAWILEMVGKGPGGKGALWVARRIPDGYISAHANQARIRQFPLGESKDTLYAKDVISFARDQGWFSGRDAEFSFADTYAPADASTLRTCEARVWNVFRRAAPSQQLTPDFIMGVPGAKPMPLWIRPDRKLSTLELMDLMRDHFEGTPFDLTKDVGAGPFHAPYRWRPLTWDVDGQTYLNERAISTQQTGWSMVTQSRAWLPDLVGAVMWFGVDDTYSTVYVPMYAALREPPHAYAPGVGTLGRFSWESAFWVFNWVANFAYSRYEDMIVDIRQVQGELEGSFLARQPAIEQAALDLYRRSPELARDYLAGYSTDAAARTVARWRSLGEALLVKYMDGNVKDELGAVKHPPYPEGWYRRIVAETGDHFRVSKPAEPPKLAPTTGYFHSRAELGELAKRVPADFPFAAEKLLLVNGQAPCHQPPRCCLKAEAGAGKERLVVTIPKGDSCSWLVRLPQTEARSVELR